MRDSEGDVRWDGHRTWYRQRGELVADGPAPIVLLHGGPGGTHDYLEPLLALAESGRPVVLYDQIGNGRSDHLRDAPREFWTVDLFKRELTCLLESLGFADRYLLLGQSWGGMLALEHALDRPGGLAGMVVADSPASMPLWISEANRLRTALPEEVQAVLSSHERDGTTDSPHYAKAVDAFNRLYVCRLDPWPEPLSRAFALQQEDPTVYGTMIGPSEFYVTGSLKDWDITEQLARITAPTLLISGLHDEATPRIVEEVHRRIEGSTWELFESSSHTPHLEEPERFLASCEAFFARLRV
jgi:L-proline amide hydrolase